MTKLQSINPHTGKVIAEYPQDDLGVVHEKLTRSDAAFKAWSKTSMAMRAELIHALGEVLAEQKSALAKTITSEMGKRLVEAQAEVDKCILLCREYTKIAPAVLERRTIKSGDRTHQIVHMPLGGILAVMPWNYPLWQVFRVLVPQLLAGNVVVLKHASNVTGSALNIYELVQSALKKCQHTNSAFSDILYSGILEVLVMSSDMIQFVIAESAIQGVTLTGSTRAGQAVAKCAGYHLKKVVLELGGNDPYLVFADADLEKAADAIIKSRAQNAGQSCIAAKRVIVEKSIEAEFTDLLAEKIRALKVGDPMDADTDIGPMVSKKAAAELADQVLHSIDAGARALVGEISEKVDSAYFPPTLLTNVPEDALAAYDELFGPVWSLQTAASEAEMLELANDSEFGLGAAVFTKDLEKAERVALALETGIASINDFVRSEPMMPFGGIKKSGHGRELAEIGLTEFVNLKSVFNIHPQRG